MDKRVGFGPRFAAAIIDGVAVGLAGFVPAAILGWMLGRQAGESGTGAAAALGAALGLVAVFRAVYFFYSLIEGFTGASPGKRLLGLKVGTAGGQEGSTPLYLKRWAVKYSGSWLGLLGAVPGLHALGLLAPAAGIAIFLGCFLVLGEKRQALHDIGAGTAVFRTADLAA
jgi:uncharacterized RDD family membrane protein YckC